MTGITAGTTIIRDADALRAALPVLLAAPVLGLDTETTGLNPHADRLRLVQLATADAVFVVDCFALPPAALTPIFTEGKRFLGHNLGFDLRFLMANQLPAPNGDRLFDTMLASQILQSGLPEPRGTHSLAGVAERYLQVKLDKTLQVSNWGGELSDAQISYAAMDAAILPRLAEKLETEIAAASMRRTAGIEMRALPAIAWLGFSGAPLDQQRWLGLAEAAAVDLKRVEAELTRETGTADLFGESSVNWNSADQVLKQLRRRGHQLERTNENRVLQLAAEDIVARLIIQHREASRKVSAYGQEFLRHVEPATGRLHADYMQIGASSGRMACGSPNLQNIPREPAYRACFTPAPGRALVKADYSQIELRIAAQLTRDPVLLTAYRNGEDVHMRTAASVLGVDPNAVTKDQRQLAKALNFGLLYGMGAPRLKEYAGQTYGVPLSEDQAQVFRERFFETYAGLRRWHREQPRRAITTRTLAGRRRLNVERFTDQLNLPVQGAGADILKLALARLWEDRGSQPSALPVLCVHDEIVLECDVEDAPAVAGWLTHHMQAAGAKLLPDVPVVADSTIAADWSGTALATSPDDPRSTLTFW